MSAREPLTWADLDEDERRFLITIRSIPPHRLPAVRRLVVRMTNGVSPAKAERLFHQDMAVADARHRLNTGTTPAA